MPRRTCGSPTSPVRASASELSSDPRQPGSGNTLWWNNRSDRGPPWRGQHLATGRPSPALLGLDTQRKWCDEWQTGRPVALATGSRYFGRVDLRIRRAGSFGTGDRRLQSGTSSATFSANECVRSRHVRRCVIYDGAPDCLSRANTACGGTRFEPSLFATTTPHVGSRMAASSTRIVADGWQARSAGVASVGSDQAMLPDA